MPLCTLIHTCGLRASAMPLSSKASGSLGRWCWDDRKAEEAKHETACSLLPKGMASRSLLIGVIVLFLVTPVHRPVAVGIDTAPIFPLAQGPSFHEVPARHVFHGYNLKIVHGGRALWHVLRMTSLPSRHSLAHGTWMLHMDRSCTMGSSGLSAK